MKNDPFIGLSWQQHSNCASDFGKKEKVGISSNLVRRSKMTPGCFQLTQLHYRNEVNERKTFTWGDVIGMALILMRYKSDERKRARQPSSLCGAAVTSPRPRGRNLCLFSPATSGFPGEEHLSLGKGPILPAPGKSLSVPEWIKHLVSLTQASSLPHQQQPNRGPLYGAFGSRANDGQFNPHNVHLCIPMAALAPCFL